MPIIENCTVVKKNKDLIYIKLTTPSNCNGCKACAFGSKNTQILPSYSELDCLSGDIVLVQMPEKQIKGAAFITYLLPLLSFLLGLLVGLPFNEVFMLIFAIIFFSTGLFLVHCWDKFFLKQKKYLPKIIEITKRKS